MNLYRENAIIKVACTARQTSIKFLLYITEFILIFIVVHNITSFSKIC